MSCGRKRDLNKAIAELQRATGNALTTNNIVVRVR